jgi:hypothetical protein
MSSLLDLRLGSIWLIPVEMKPQRKTARLTHTVNDAGGGVAGKAGSVGGSALTGAGAGGRGDGAMPSRLGAGIGGGKMRLSILGGTTPGETAAAPNKSPKTG